MKPDFKLGPIQPNEMTLAQIETARGLGLSPPRPRSGPLAVVGGGHSIHAYIETLRRWKGEIWAINGAWKWLKDQGIESTFYTCDPLERTALFAQGAKKAISFSMAHPLLWELVPDCEMLDERPWFAFSAPNAVQMAVPLGFESITFFGCDCSFSNDSHVYEKNDVQWSLVVECGGMEYLTVPTYYIQAQELKAVIKTAPFFRERSGGLLRAMVENDTFKVTWMSDSVKEMFS